MRLKIAGGRLYDPSCGWRGVARDLFIEKDRIASRVHRVDKIIEASGSVVVAGGLDLRAPVATYGLNFRRAGALPSPRELGEAYAALGYTHVHEPFLTWFTANYVHSQLAALPVVDASASLVVNLRDLDLWLRSPEQLPEVGETLQFLLEKTRALSFRVVEPYIRYRQEFYAHRTLALDAALEVLAQLAASRKIQFTLEASPEVLRAGLPEAKLFHLAGLGPALGKDELQAAALKLLAAGATGDMGLSDPRGGPGQAAPGMEVDLGWFQPLDLSPRRDEAAARRALSLALEYDGDRLAFSGAGLGQAGVLDYPRLFSWLADSEERRRDWGADLGSGQYSLERWVWATRTLPARVLGLPDRGHLRPGARADVAIYDPAPGTDPGRWRCRTLLKAGELVVEDYHLMNPGVARVTCYRQTGAAETELLAEICRYRSLRPENLWVPPELPVAWEQV